MHKLNIFYDEELISQRKNTKEERPHRNNTFRHFETV